MTKFKSLAPEDYPLLKRFFVDLKTSLSIYSLPSLISWNNQVYRSSYVLIDDLLVIVTLSKHHPDQPYLIQPLSPSREATPQELHELAITLGCREFRFIPEDYLSRCDHEEVTRLFMVAEQPEYADYIYHTNDLGSLAGRRFAKKRNHLNQFIRDYLEPGLVKTEAITADNKAECLDFILRWCEEYPCDGPESESLACEQEAIAIALENIELFELCGFAIRVEGVISAFAITARLNDRMGVLNFEKAFSRINGLYQFLDQQCSQKCLNAYEFTNKESDMGLPGLAQSKRSYYPCDRVKSYQLKLI
ncbi:MAG: phosphatidylglycerol lysyltransferase domain-containing protein [Smithellaceae bacterium]|nr:phosphatidylglycerol lysyltransferase domain-containing protein [Smithellaceae bacterium]